MWTIAIIVATVASWFLVGWLGVALVAWIAVALVIAWTIRRSQHATLQLSELERLVTWLGDGEDASLDSFQLCPPWAAIGKNMIETHRGLLRQLRERQAALQKIELSQSLVQAAQRRAEAIVAGLSDAVLVTNTFGELLHANPEAERLFGFALDKNRGRAIRQIIAHVALAHVFDHVSQRGHGNQRHTEEVQLVLHDKQMWFKVTAAVLLDNKSEPLGIIMVLRDITKEKAAQARSAEFVSAVSHEIKTPLASVKAYAEMLADGDAAGDPETQHKFLNIIEVQTDRMTRLLESMLDMARIESGVVRVDKRVVSLNELIEGGAKLMAPAALDKSLTIETRLSSLYLAVSVDPDMMSRVVMNLVSNAIKYTDAGGRITLRSHIVGDQVAFEVEDTGRGIPADALPKLFQKFYRVKENANVAPGTGLGLSLVKHIVEEVHGGKIDVRSEVGKGTTFRVTLPLERLN